MKIEEKERKMETKIESHCWWFNSYNSSKSTPWLESTLSELNDKTKTMLKLIEEDADSFAQRAEMYYKKRPELISMVEDFYRAHRSLAERYDQLKSDRVVRVKSPLRHSLSLPKEEYDYVLDSVYSVKPFDSFTEAAFSYEEVAESEIDDPEHVEDDAQIEKAFAGVASYDELMKLRDELDRLREENEIQKNIIKQKDEEKEEIVKRLSDDIRELREEAITVRKENLGVVKKQNEAVKPFDEVTNLKDGTIYEKKQVQKKSEVIEVMKKFEAEKTKNIYLQHELARKEEETLEVARQFEETKLELEKVREEMKRMNEQLKDALEEKDEETEDVIEQLKKALTEMDKLKHALAQKAEAFTQLKCAFTENDEVIRQLNNSLLQKDEEKLDAIRQLKCSLTQKDEEKHEAIRQMKCVITQKDEEKREAIRQLSIAMEMIREESKLLKKSAVQNSPRKSNANAADFQIFRGVNLGKLFNPS